MVERFRSRGGPYILLPNRLCAGPDRPAPLDLAGCRPYSARKLERRLDLGGTEHSLELGTHPHCTSLCANPCATRRVGRLLRPRLRDLGGAADNVENSRLRLGGMAVGPVRPMPTHVCRRQNSCRCARRHPKLRTARARDDREHGAHAPTGLHRRCGRLRLAGTKGILVSSFLSPLSFSASVFCPSVCVYSSAARAASNRRKP